MLNESAADLSARRSPVPISECALAQAISVIGDAWTLLILREVLCGVHRFESIREDLGIPRSVLSERLRQLIDNEILEQRPYRDPGQRTRDAYVFTDKGRALTTALIALRAWAEEFVLHKPSRLRVRDGEGHDVFARLVRADNSPVEDLSRITAVLVDGP